MSVRPDVFSDDESAFWEANEAVRLDLLAKVREDLRACGLVAGSGEQLGGARLGALSSLPPVPWPDAGV